MPRPPGRSLFPFDKRIRKLRSLGVGMRSIAAKIPGSTCWGVRKYCEQHDVSGPEKRKPVKAYNALILARIAQEWTDSQIAAEIPGATKQGVARYRWLQGYPSGREVRQDRRHAAKQATVMTAVPPVVKKPRQVPTDPFAGFRFDDAPRALRTVPRFQAPALLR